MAKFSIGDLVVLKSGSMRMCVEGVDDGAETISAVWCNEGVIGRDTFAVALLNKWEHREDNRSHGGKPHGGDRDGGGKPLRGGDRGGDRGPRGNDRGNDRGGDHGSDKPRRQGWDGKPREKKYYRSDD